MLAVEWVLYLGGALCKGQLDLRSGWQVTTKPYTQQDSVYILS